MGNKEVRQERLTTCLLIVYLIVLTWIILFKMQFSFKELGYFRAVNLIPLQESVIVNGKIQFSEIYENMLVFVPFGLYISMLKSNWSFLKKVAPIIGVSLFYEVTQYILAIGASDITDFITNTFGGVIGIIIYLILSKIFKKDFKRDKILNAIALIATICIISLLSTLVMGNT